MKRLINPLPTGGVPIENEDILTLQNEGFDALKQMCAGLPGAFVLSGCGSVIGTETYYDNSLPVGIGYLSTNASIKVNVPAGYVWLDGDIKYFAGGVFSTPFYIKSDVATYAKKTLQDGTLKNVYVTSNAVGGNSRPATGQYITCNPTPEFVFGDVITAKVQAALATEISTRQTVQASERAERLSAITTLTQQLGQLNDALQTKTTKKIGFINWTDLPLNSGFTTETNSTGFNTAQYMRTEDGFVHLRGVLHFAMSATGSPAIYLPNGFGVIKESRISTSTLVGSPATNLGITISISYNNVYVSPNSNTNNAPITIFLDGINYYADGIGGVQ